MSCPVKQCIWWSQLWYWYQNDQTALHLAASLGRGTIVRLLLSRGADVNLLDSVSYIVGIVELDLSWRDLIWFDMIWYDEIWYDMKWYDRILFDMIWLVWYDMI